MDAAIWNAFGQITDWPAHDVFPQVLTTIMRNGFD